jgi:hypothetical protein
MMRERKRAHDLGVLGGMEEENERKETRKFSAVTRGLKAGCQSQTSTFCVCFFWYKVIQ